MHKMLIMMMSIAACFATSARADPTFPDRGRAGVVDAAGVLPPDQERALNDRVVAWDRATGHQLVVATVPNLQNLDIKDYGYRLGRAWGLGDKKRNDGAILLLAMAERKVRIEVGYGLEAALTDAKTGQILRDRVVPRLKDGNPALALSDGADAIMQAAGRSVTSSAAAVAVLPSPGHQPYQQWLFAVICGIAAISFAARARRALSAIGRIRSYEGARAARLRARAASPISPPDARDRLVVDAAPEHPRDRPIIAPANPIYAATPSGYVPSSRSSDYDAPSSSSSDWGSSFGSSDSSSSSSGFDSGGGSFGGGGSDSSW